jgi:phthiodiolone/phenolphthiodiolone dimycocerosates ketoreductase
MLRLIGQYGDGWYPSEINTPQEYADRLKIIRAAAQEAGRDPQAITPALFRLIAVAPAEQEARAMLDTKPGRLMALGMPAEEWRKVGAKHPFGEHFRGAPDWLPEQYDRETLEEGLAAVPQELLGTGLIWGTPQQVVDKLRAFSDAGVRHMVIFPASALLSRRLAIYGLMAIRSIARSLRNGQHVET